ncbi:MAG: EAL domain-containing protein [Gammaproteobacteria bacterium]
MDWLNPKISLRLKLVLGSLFVQIIMVTLLVINSVWLVEKNLTEHMEKRLSEIAGLLNISLIKPLMQKDYGTLAKLLDEHRRNNQIAYLVLSDAHGEIVGASGWNTNQLLPKLDSQIDYSDAHSSALYDTQTSIHRAGQVYGNLRYGISTRFSIEARSRFLNESLLISLAVVILSTMVLTFLGYWLTRHLKELMRAGEAVTAGNFNIRVPVKTRDEIGQLTTTFNNMAATMRKRVEELSASESKFHTIADYTYDWEDWYSPRGKLIWINTSVERISGYTPAECLQMHNFPLAIIFPDDYEKVSAAFKRATRGGVANDFEYRIVHKQGEVLWVSASWQPIYNKQGEYLGRRSSVRDIYERKLAEEMLEGKIVELTQAEEMQRNFLLQAQQEHARLTSLLSVMSIGILFVSADNRVVYYNPAFLRIWMIPESVGLIGKLATEIFNYSANVLDKPDDFSSHIKHILQAQEGSDSFEIPIAGGRMVTQLSYLVHDEAHGFSGRLWVYEDITRERQTAEQLVYLAEHDSLTGLYNRHRFQDDLERAIVGAERSSSNVALLFFDLDGFKYANDTFGHRAGDTILIRIANEVSGLVRRNEILGRLGGDEFAVLAAGVTEGQVEALAERIIRAIAQLPFRFEEKNLRLTASVGIAIFPEHAANAAELIAHADRAMYQAKEAGKNTWRIYSPEINTYSTSSQINWNERILHALENNLLRLHFQGIYHAKDSSLSSLEVLVRMVDEDSPGQLILPGNFISFAEKSGKILDIDRWVIHQTIMLLASSDNIPDIAVNVSGRSFDEASLPHYIHDRLQQYHVNPKRLQVELTETAAVSDLHDAQRFIEILHQSGCKVSLDDFGAGFSSFTYLKHLEADILKIDGSFIRDLPNDPDSQVFVKAIVDIAHGLDKITVAEFVESAETLEMLKRFGVDRVQGYYLDIPHANHWAIMQPDSKREGLGFV